MYKTKANLALQVLLIMALCCQVTVTATSYLTLKRRWKAQKKFCMGLLGKFWCICIMAMSKSTKFNLSELNLVHDRLNNHIFLHRSDMVCSVV